MSQYCDWEVIQWKKAPTKARQLREGTIGVVTKTGDDETQARNRKLDNVTDAGHVDVIPRAFRQLMIQARVAKKLSQTQLANHLNLQTNVIACYENGKAIPVKKTTRAICKFLNIKSF